MSMCKGMLMQNNDMHALHCANWQTACDMKTDMHVYWVARKSAFVIVEVTSAYFLGTQ